MRASERDLFGLIPSRFSLLRGLLLFWNVYVLFMVADTVQFNWVSRIPPTLRVMQVASVPVSAFLLWSFVRQQKRRGGGYWLYSVITVVLQLSFSLGCPVWW